MIHPQKIVPTTARFIEDPLKVRYILQNTFYITPYVKCGFTHASRVGIRIFTPRDIKFRTILVRKTFSWRVWLLVLQTHTRQKTFHCTRIAMYYHRYSNAVGIYFPDKKLYLSHIIIFYFHGVNVGILLQKHLKFVTFRSIFKFRKKKIEKKDRLPDYLLDNTFFYHFVDNFSTIIIMQNQCSWYL